MLQSTRATLLSRIRDPADQDAWREFEQRYRDLIVRYARARGLSAADAEDACQMVMLRLMRALPEFRYDPARGRFHDYLYRVIRSAISDLKRCPESPPGGVLPAEVADPRAGSEFDAAWQQEWMNHHLRQALDHVRRTSDERSVALFERLLAGARLDEAAAEFGMTPETAQKVKQRMRDRVQSRIAEQIREEDTIDA